MTVDGNLEDGEKITDAEIDKMFEEDDADDLEDEKADNVANNEDTDFMNKIENMSGGDDAEADPEDGDPIKTIFGEDI